MPKIELIDFYAPWCEPCQAMMPIIDEIAKQYDQKITVTKINIDKNPFEAQKYQIMSIPSFVFKEDNSVQNQLVGMQTKENISRILDKLLGK